MLQLSKQDQETLLQIARDSVQAHLTGQQLELPSMASEDLMQKRGVFVSIYLGIELERMCGNNRRTESSVSKCCRMRSGCSFQGLAFQAASIVGTT